MAPAEDYDDDRHRRDEAERRGKRKAAKSQKSDAQLDRERKRKEHAQKILQKHGGERKKSKPGPSSGGGGGGAAEGKKSAFQEIFSQRAQGFQIDFKFRNAPPRPPVGPCFVGHGIDGVLLDLSQYKPLNAVEVSHRWKLHSEDDLGVPLAPSAMDPKSYTPSTTAPPLHPDDKSLLEWKGSLGDTAAEELKKRRDHARAVARLALMGKSPAKLLMEKSKPTVTTSSATTSSKKAFSRVLDETMQSWMKKTTYLSNDYTRKVHDFKSLAKTKQELAQDLEVRQQEISQRRSAKMISKTFEECKRPVKKHPTRSHLKPVAEMPFLPNVGQWGQSFTHVVVDKAPNDVNGLDKAFVANVHKKDVTSRMTCQVFVPSAEAAVAAAAAVTDEDEAKTSPKKYQALHQYELDVLPLKEEDTPHFNFCIWVDTDSKRASYLPISSRVQLSGGRPLKKKNYVMNVSRRAMDEKDREEMDEKIAEVDVDVEEKLRGGGGTTTTGAASSRKNKLQIDSDDDDGIGEADDGEDDDDYNDSDQGESFVNNNRTIVAEG